MPDARPANKRLGPLPTFERPETFHTVAAFTVAADMTGAGGKNSRPDSLQMINGNKTIQFLQSGLPGQQYLPLPQTQFISYPPIHPLLYHIVQVGMDGINGNIFLDGRNDCPFDIIFADDLFQATEDDGVVRH